MDLREETEDYIRESTQYLVGLPVSNKFLLLKLHTLEESNRQLRNQNLSLQAESTMNAQALKRFVEENQRLTEACRDYKSHCDAQSAESTMNAHDLKRLVEENQKLAEECRDLLEECTNLKTECGLYERDREVLMDFGDEADGRARESEQRVVELKDAVRKLEEELQNYKSVDATGYSNYKEQQLVEQFFPHCVDKVDAASTARALFEANGVLEDFKSLVTTLSSLSPYASKVLALVADVISLQKANDILRNNLVAAEEEVEALFQENETLDAENKRIKMESVGEKRIAGSGGCRSNSASSTKGHKRKSSTNLLSDRSVEKKIDYGDEDLLRSLSPLQLNSPECKLQAHSVIEAAKREEVDHHVMLEEEVRTLRLQEEQWKKAADEAATLLSAQDKAKKHRSRLYLWMRS